MTGLLQPGHDKMMRRVILKATVVSKVHRAILSRCSEHTREALYLCRCGLCTPQVDRLFTSGKGNVTGTL